jgi:hypothetical protein
MNYRQWWNAGLQIEKRSPSFNIQFSSHDFVKMLGVRSIIIHIIFSIGITGI